MSVTPVDLDILWNKLDKKIATLMDNQKYLMECLEQLCERIEILEPRAPHEIH